jgi:hypothetical protein
MANPYPYKRYGMIDTPTAMGGGVAFRPSAPPGSMQGMPTQQARSYLEFLALQKKKREEEAAVLRQHQMREAAPQGLLGTNVRGGPDWTDWVSERIDAEGDAGGHTDWIAEMASGTDPVALLNASADTSKVDHMLNAALRNLGETLIPSAQAAGPASAETSLLNQGPIPPGTAGIGDDPVTEFKWVWNPYEQAEVRVPANWTDERIAASFEAAQTEAAVAPEPGSTFRGATNYELGPSLATRAARQDEGVTGQMYPETVEPVLETPAPVQIPEGGPLGESQELEKPLIPDPEQPGSTKIVTDASQIATDALDGSTGASPEKVAEIATSRLGENVNTTIPWEARNFLGLDLKAKRERYLTALNDIFTKAMILNVLASLTGAESNAGIFMEMAFKKLDTIMDFDGKERLQKLGRLVFFDADGNYNPPTSRRNAFDRYKRIGATDDEAQKGAGLPAIPTDGTIAAEKKAALFDNAENSYNTALKDHTDSPSDATARELSDAEAYFTAVKAILGIGDSTNQKLDNANKIYGVLFPMMTATGKRRFTSKKAGQQMIPSGFLAAWMLGKPYEVDGKEVQELKSEMVGGFRYYKIKGNLVPSWPAYLNSFEELSSAEVRSLTLSKTAVSKYTKTQGDDAQKKEIVIPPGIAEDVQTEGIVTQPGITEATGPSDIAWVTQLGLDPETTQEVLKDLGLVRRNPTENNIGIFIEIWGIDSLPHDLRRP